MDARVARERRRAALRTFCVCVWVASAPGCPAPLEPEAGRRPNVVLFSVDTLRADRVQATDAGGAAAPFLDELARGGVRFTRAYATSSWTAPSVASLLTAVYPSRHGVKHGTWLGTGGAAQEVLPDALPFLPEILRDAGYATFGIASNVHLSPTFGFGRGFIRYRCLYFSGARDVSEQLREWLPELRQRQPFFLWLHFIDPHAPYGARDPWLSQRWPARRPRHPELEKVRPAALARRERPRPGSERLAYLEALYDSEVSLSEAVMREVAAELSLDAGALVIATSDHGEEFLENDGFGHGRTLYEESIRVPLVLRLPDGSHAREVVETPVSLVDVMPTVLDALGLAAPAELQGRSVLPLLRGEAVEPRPVFTALERMKRNQQRAVIEGDRKLVHYRKPREVWRLFRLDGDRDRPVQEGAEPETTRRLRGLLEAHVTAAAPSQTVPVGPEEVEALRALGYLEEAPRGPADGRRPCEALHCGPGAAARYVGAGRRGAATAPAEEERHGAQARVRRPLRLRAHGGRLHRDRRGGARAQPDARGGGSAGLRGSRDARLCGVAGGRRGGASRDGVARGDPRGAGGEVGAGRLEARLRGAHLLSPAAASGRAQ